MICGGDRKILRDYLMKALKNLHQELDECNEPIEAAPAEGAIVELEILWSELLHEDPPTKLDLKKLK